MNLPKKSSKIVLSPAEWGMATQPAFILTKNRIIASVYEMFGMLANDYWQHQGQLAVSYPEVCGLPPKISKGEKYEDMPWVMLDYPRHFAASGDHFAIRTFFWWGHFFSLQLHASGCYAPRLLPMLPQLEALGWLTGCTAYPWSHHLPNEQWKAPSLYDGQSEALPYIKAAKKIPIERWESVPLFITEQYRQLVQIITN